MKTEILDKVAGVMFDVNPFPSQKQVEGVAKALVEKHPCLKKPGTKADGLPGNSA